ncbi:MAG: arsenate reductase (glutaredoxin) [bacterium]|nr:arsenate reductase (glutaredoxin) [bacterium]
MPDVVMYHNPKCSKSRQTLQLLREQGIEPRIVEYLKTPLDEDTLAHILGMLGMDPIDLIRKTEDEYQELGLEEKKADRKALIRAMISHPILIERPIVMIGNQARIGRPPESVLEML